MKLFPALRIGWLNGLLPMGILYLIFGILLLVFPKEVVGRLYERSNWSREQRVIMLIGKSMALVWFPLIILTPLKIGTPVFVLGMALFALGLDSSSLSSTSGTRRSTGRLRRGSTGYHATHSSSCYLLPAWASRLP
jgi:hypothetical protein